MDPNNITGALGGNQTNNVEGIGAEPSVTTSPIDLDLQELAANYSSMANIIEPGGTYSNINWGDLNNYNVVHITGDLHTAGAVSGGGVLIIDGDYTSTGQFTWYGLVIVLGDMTFSGGGAGVHIYGSTLVQGGIDQQTVGDNADMLYSSEALSRLSQLATYTAVSWLEL